MTKANRQNIFDKYGGRCAYCGEPLQKGWHVDEIEPVRRNYKHIPAHYAEISAAKKKAGILPKWVPAKNVVCGCDHPERFHINNQNPACPSCNINKHSMSLEDFRNLIAGFMKHLNEVSTQYKIAKRYGLVKEDIKPAVFYFETYQNKTIR